MIQTHKKLLYVSGISLFLPFFNGRGILLGKVGQGHLLGQGCLLGRIQYFIFMGTFEENLGKLIISNPTSANLNT